MENYKNSKIGLETAQKYGDILEMGRPQTEESLRKHPRMTLQNRGTYPLSFTPSGSGVAVQMKGFFLPGVRSRVTPSFSFQADTACVLRPARSAHHPAAVPGAPR